MRVRSRSLFGLSASVRVCVGRGRGDIAAVMGEGGKEGDGAGGGASQQVQTGHTAQVHDSQLDFYGTRLATCSSDRTVKVFDVAKGASTLQATLQAHEGPVWQVSWGHPKFASLLASVGYDRRVVVWREQGQGHWVKVYENTTAHSASINCCAFAPVEHGLHLATGSSDGSFVVHSYGTGGEWTTVKVESAHTLGVLSLSWAPAMASPAAGGRPLRRLVTSGCDGLVKVWVWKEEDNSWGMEPNGELRAHGDWVRSVAWSQLPTSTSSEVASASQDGKVIVWSQEAPGQPWKRHVLCEVDSIVWCVAWSLTGDLLAVQAAGKEVALWTEDVKGRWKQIDNEPRK